MSTCRVVRLEEIRGGGHEERVPLAHQGQGGRERTGGGGRRSGRREDVEEVERVPT